MVHAAPWLPWAARLIGQVGERRRGYRRFLVDEPGGVLVHQLVAGELRTVVQPAENLVLVARRPPHVDPADAMANRIGEVGRPLPETAFVDDLAQRQPRLEGHCLVPERFHEYLTAVVMRP